MTDFPTNSQFTPNQLYPGGVIQQIIDNLHFKQTNPILIGQGVYNNVSYFFNPAPIDGSQFSLAAQVFAGDTIPGNKVAIFGAVRTGLGGSDVWGSNFLAHWGPNDPDCNVQTVEFDFNNMNSDQPRNPPKLKVGVNITSGGQYLAGYALYIDSTRHGQNSWREAIHINDGSVTDCGVNICAGALPGTIAGRQLTNGGDTILLQRRTDISPGGNFIRLVNATNNQTLLSISINGLINAPNMPTTATGLPSGSLWNNNGVVNIVP